MRLTQSELIMSRKGSRLFVKEINLTIEFVVAESSLVTYKYIAKIRKKYFFINTGNDFLIKKFIFYHFFPKSSSLDAL